MSVLPKVIDGLSAIAVKTPMILFKELEKSHLKIHMEAQKTSNQSNPERKEQSWRRQSA
jgi:hypothetical protein